MKNTIKLAIGVDDTGNEANEFLARSVDPKRCTLVAAIISDENINSFNVIWSKLISEINKIFPNATEFHASHMMSRTGEYKNVIGKKKDAKNGVLNLIKTLSKLIADCEIIFYVQTVTSETYVRFIETIKEVDLSQESKLELIKILSEGNHNKKLVSFFLLAKGIARRLKANNGTEEFNFETRWEIDKSADFSAIPIPIKNAISSSFGSFDFQFIDSNTSSLIQLADFGAYVLNRHQYLAANRPTGPSEEELKFLEATRPCLSCFLNVQIKNHKNSSEMTPESYDNFQDNFRKPLGLQPQNFKKK